MHLADYGDQCVHIDPNEPLALCQVECSHIGFGVAECEPGDQRIAPYVPRQPRKTCSNHRRVQALKCVRYQQARRGLSVQDVGVDIDAKARLGEGERTYVECDPSQRLVQVEGALLTSLYFE